MFFSTVFIFSLVFFDISLEVAIERISGRRLCPDTKKVYNIYTNPPPKDIEKNVIKRKDDTKEKVEHRYDVYQNETSPLIEYYGSNIVTIDATQHQDDILKTIEAEIKKTIVNPA